MSRLIFLLPVLLFAVIVSLFFYGLYFVDRSLESSLIGRKVPDFSLPPVTLDRPGLATKDLVGKVSLVNFYASWCIPCQAEHPLFTKLAQQGILPLYGIAWKDDLAANRKWLVKLGNPYNRLGLDRENQVGLDFGVYGVPETFVIDAQGRIRLRHAGPLTPQILADLIMPAIEAANVE